MEPSGKSADSSARVHPAGWGSSSPPCSSVSSADSCAEPSAKTQEDSASQTQKKKKGLCTAAGFVIVFWLDFTSLLPLFSPSVFGKWRVEWRRGAARLLFVGTEVQCASFSLCSSVSSALLPSASLQHHTCHLSFTCNIVRQCCFSIRKYYVCVC